MYFCSRSQTNSKKQCVLEKSCVDQWIRDGKTRFFVPGSLLLFWSWNYWAGETEVQTILTVMMFGMVREFGVQRDAGSWVTHGCRELFSKGKFPGTDNPRSNAFESTSRESNSVSGIYTFICYHHNLGRGRSCVTKCLFRYSCLTC